MTHKNDYSNLDITNRRFGKLTAKKKIEGYKARWLFQCDCGNERILCISQVIHGKVKSCGCLLPEVQQNLVKRTTKHGDSAKKIHNIYVNMISRCTNPNHVAYKRYGDRGIKVCDEWLNSYEKFKEWAYSTGFNPNLKGIKEQSLDRKNNDEGYSPSNCRWVNVKEQQRNRESVKKFPYKEEMYCMIEFSEKFQIPYSYVKYKISKNKSYEDILCEWKEKNDIPQGYVDTETYAKMKGVARGSVWRWYKNGAIDGVLRGKKLYVKT